MASESVEAREFDSVRRMLEGIEDDRRGLGLRMTAETWWAAPAQGVGAGLMVAAPAAGLTWGWLLFLTGVAIFFVVETVFQRRSGLSISGPAGPRGLVLVVGLGCFLAVALAAGIILSFLGLIAAVCGIAVIAGGCFALGVVAYDRVYAIEVARVR